MEEEIQKILEEKVNPVLNSHLGGAVLSRIENGIAFVRLTGACGGCPSSQFTLEDVIKTAILDEIPELEDVQLDTSVSDELLDMARSILKKDKN